MKKVAYEYTKKTKMKLSTQFSTPTHFHSKKFFFNGICLSTYYLQTIQK